MIFKIIPHVFLSATLLIFNPILAQTNDKDFTYDKESQSIIPKYLGKVILLKGVAQANRAGKSISLSKGAKIYPKDILNTQERSFLKIEMVDKTLMTAGPSSKLSFENWQYKTKEDRKGTFNLIQGKMRAHFKVKAKEENSLKIKVGHVAMGVRGTRIMANKYNQTDGTQVSHLVTLEGKTQIYDQVKDYQVNHEGGDQYISFLKRDGTILKNEDGKLSPTELQYLKSDDKDPMKYFKPFLKEFKGKSIENNSQGSSAGSAHSYQKSTFSGKKKKSWKKTLNKLNNRLNSDD
jgi:hypothetical protein